MVYPFPQGTLSLVESVNWLANRKNDDWTIWSDLQQVALREIFDAARTENLRAYVLDSARQSHEADRAQFAALGDQDPMMLSLQEFLATTRRITHFGQTRMLHLLPADREDQVHGKLFFFLNDLEGVFGEDAPAESSFDERAASQVRASVTDDEITDFVKGAGCSAMNAAWLLVKAKLPGVKQERFRELWNKGSFGGPRGRPANCVKK